MWLYTRLVTTIIFKQNKPFKKTFFRYLAGVLLIFWERFFTDYLKMDASEILSSLVRDN